jgi:AraC-like DNA-binding protein
MHQQSVYTLIDPQTGKLAFKVAPFTDNTAFDHLQHNNYYSLIWVQEGSGTVKADYAEYAFTAGSLFSFSVYQPFMICAGDIKGVAIHFHPDFFCIFKHQAEVACNGVLFNNVYQPPFVMVSDAAEATFDQLLGQMKTEMQDLKLAQHELLVSYLKIFLITAARLKTEQNPEAMLAVSDSKEPYILQGLKDAIEKDFKSKHTAADYAEALNISPKTLAKISKKYFNKTLTDLIAERIVIEAKRELYLTNKTVKEIAYGLGYQDEYYFSRFFKKNTEVSPQMYRETVGFDRAMA